MSLPQSGRCLPNKLFARGLTYVSEEGPPKLEPNVSTLLETFESELPACGPFQPGHVLWNCDRAARAEAKDGLAPTRATRCAEGQGLRLVGPGSGVQPRLPASDVSLCAESCLRCLQSHPNPPNSLPSSSHPYLPKRYAFWKGMDLYAVIEARDCYVLPIV